MSKHKKFNPHKIAVKLLVRPFVWANKREKQNVITIAIRKAWRTL